MLIVYIIFGASLDSFTKDSKDRNCTLLSLQKKVKLQTRTSFTSVAKNFHQSYKILWLQKLQANDQVTLKIGGMLPLLSVGHLLSFATIWAEQILDIWMTEHSIPGLEFQALLLTS